MSEQVGLGADSKESAQRNRRRKVNYSEPRLIEMSISKDTLKELIAVHLQAMSIVRDREDVIVDFDPKNLKAKGDLIPLSLKIKHINSSKEEVTSQRLNGKGEKL